MGWRHWTHRLGTVGLLLAILALLISPASAVQAASQPSIRIANGNPLSITGTEQPQIVVQFGNQGDRLNNVRVVCTWNSLIRFNGQVQTGPFPNAELVVPGFTGLPSLFFPNRTVTDAAKLPDLPQGQSYNVAFGIRLQLPSPSYTGPAGTVQCSLLDAQFHVLAQSAKLAVVVR